MSRHLRTLDDWLLHIAGVHPVGWDLGLERVRTVGERLDCLHPAPVTVLIAGTNGKGSTCEFLAAIAAADGKRVGKSTSPHLHRFNERIVIDGVPLGDAEISAAFEAIDVARAEVTLTYFEFAALASMLLFRQAGVDIAILEIGLGGRLDAMNIVDPDLSIITSISLDHQDWLGDTRHAIAFEKAGIMRPGVTCIVADRDPPASLVNHAIAIGAPLLRLGVDFEVPTHASLQLPVDSYAAALEAAKQLGLDVSGAGELAASVTLPGRRTRSQDVCPVLLDVAHNPAAAESLNDYLCEYFPAVNVHAVLGMYRDKDIEAVTGALAARVKTWHLTSMDEPRAATATELLDRLAGVSHGTMSPYANIGEAVAGVRALAGKDDLILVFGSFPVVAGALRLFDGDTPRLR